MTRRYFARADAVTHTPAEDLTPCPGRCNAAYRRAQADYEDAYNRWADTTDANGRTDQPEPEHHGITFWPARPVWGTSQYAPSLDRYGQVTIIETHVGCTERISSALIHIKQLWQDVPRSGMLMMAEPSERHGTKEPPSPSPAFDETDALDRWLLQLQHHLAARLGHHQATSAPVALRYLAEHTTALLCDPDAEQIGRDIMTWERRLRSIIGAQQVTRMPGTCLACGARGMLRHGNAEDLVKCRSCGASWDWDTYHRDIVGQVAG